MPLTGAPATSHAFNSVDSNSSITGLPGFYQVSLNFLLYLSYPSRHVGVIYAGAHK
jgi:hypothetical protein